MKQIFALLLCLATVFAYADTITQPNLVKPWYASPQANPTGRLSLTSNVPVTTADVTAATTIYYTAGNAFIYNGTYWMQFTLAQLTLAVPATTATGYDVYLCYNSGTPNLQTVTWSNTTTPPTRDLQNGFLVEHSTPTCLLVGAFETSGTSGQTTDSQANRLLSNYYNRTQKQSVIVDGTTSWTYGSATWRQTNANTADQVNFFFVDGTAPAEAEYSANGSPPSGGPLYVAIGLNATNAVASGGTTGQQGVSTGTINNSTNAFWQGFPAAGINYVASLESTAGGTASYSGRAPFFGLFFIGWF